MKEISKNSSRLSCEYDTQDPYNKKPEFSKVEEVVISEYNSDDLYQEVSLVQMMRTVVMMINLLAITLFFEALRLLSDNVVDFKQHQYTM